MEKEERSLGDRFADLLDPYADADDGKGASAPEPEEEKAEVEEEKPSQEPPKRRRKKRGFKEGFFGSISELGTGAFKIFDGSDEDDYEGFVLVQNGEILTLQDYFLEEYGTSSSFFFREIPEGATLEEVVVEYGFFIFGRRWIGGGHNASCINQPEDISITLEAFLSQDVSDLVVELEPEDDEDYPLDPSNRW